MPDEKKIRRMVRSVVYRTLGMTDRDGVRKQRPLVTELDVRDLPFGSEFPISQEALITPLARQVAMDRDVTFVPEGPPREPTAGSSAARRSTAGGKQVVALGADHGGFTLKTQIHARLEELGYAVVDCGTHSAESVDYPDFALAVAQLVASSEAWRGIIIDGAGIGSCMAANKVPGVLAAMCYDQATAVNSREHNDANVLTLGAGLLGANLAQQIVKTWLETPFGGGRHARRVEKIHAIGRRYGRA